MMRRAFVGWALILAATCIFASVASEAVIRRPDGLGLLMLVADVIVGCHVIASLARDRL